MIRVLHVVENFNGQAVESWLLRLLSHPSFDTEEFRFDFFLLGVGAGRDAKMLIDWGCEVHEGNPHGNRSLPAMAGALRGIVRSGGYDVIHVHQDVIAGVFAVWLVDLDTPIVTHAHNCLLRLPVGGKFKEKILTYFAMALVRMRSRGMIGVSEQALEGLTNGQRRSNQISRVIYCSANVNFESVSIVDGRLAVFKEIREQLKIPQGAKIILYLGRLDEYKNPLFVVDVLEKLHHRNRSETYLVIAGTGVLTNDLAALAAEKGLGEYVRMMGWVANPSSLLLAADLLLVPSSETCGEGLGLVAVEAQAHGLPVLSSLSIPDDAALGESLLFRKSLSEGASAWAEKASELLEKERLDLAQSVELFMSSPFTTAHSLHQLVSLYRDIVQGGVAK